MFILRDYCRRNCLHCILSFSIIPWHWGEKVTNNVCTCFVMGYFLVKSLFCIHTKCFLHKNYRYAAFPKKWSIHRLHFGQLEFNSGKMMFLFNSLTYCKTLTNGAWCWCCYSKLKLILKQEISFIKINSRNKFLIFHILHLLTSTLEP